MIEIDFDELEAVFERHDNQYDALIDIYRLAFPGTWDSISRIDGSPYVSQSTWEHICRLFVVFDQKYHSSVLEGGLWLNRGFSTKPGMPDNLIDISHLTVEYKEEAVC